MYVILFFSVKEHLGFGVKKYVTLRPPLKKVLKNTHRVSLLKIWHDRLQSHITKLRKKPFKKILGKMFFHRSKHLMCILVYRACLRTSSHSKWAVEEASGISQPFIICWGYAKWLHSDMFLLHPLVPGCMTASFVYNAGTARQIKWICTAFLIPVLCPSSAVWTQFVNRLEVKERMNRIMRMEIYKHWFGRVFLAGT